MVFDRLKSSFKKFVDSVSSTLTQKELSEDVLEPLLNQLLIDLIESEVAYEAAQTLVDTIKGKLIGTKIPRFTSVEEYIFRTLKETLVTILEKSYANLDLVEIASKRPGSNPLRLVFFGVNGVGKTTTIAKFAYLFKQNKITPVIVAADTFRAGAQEQLRKHAEKLGIPFIGGKYGADPGAVVFDAMEYARSRGYRVLLVDTAGRMHTDYDLMEELKKIVRVSKPDYKILVLDALAGNDSIEQSRFFDEAVGVDFIVVTKVDADVKGGIIISVVATINKPVLYIGIGQKYEDLERFIPEKYVSKIIQKEK